MYGSTTKVVQILTLVDLNPFYAKVKFGDIGFCMGKSENYLFFGNCCSLGSQSCLKHLAKGHSLTLVKGHSDFKVKCLTFGLYTQVSDSGPHGPLVPAFLQRATTFVTSCLLPWTIKGSTSKGKNLISC